MLILLSGFVVRHQIVFDMVKTFKSITLKHFRVRNRYQIASTNVDSVAGDGKHKAAKGNQETSAARLGIRCLTRKFKIVLGRVATTYSNREP